MNADDLRDLAEKIEQVRFDALFDEDGDNRGDERLSALSPVSEQEFLLALGHLDIAARHIKLAAYALMQKR